MTIRIIKGLLLFAIVSIFSSCEKNHYGLTNVYAENQTSSEYLIYLDYKSFIDSESNKQSIVLPNASKQIINTYLIEGSDDYFVGYPFYAWIYNKTDSTYMKIYSEDLFQPCAYGRIEMNKTKQNLPTLVENTYITINDSLTSKMIKNTHLSDSIFGLKK